MKTHLWPHNILSKQSSNKIKNPSRLSRRLWVRLVVHHHISLMEQARGVGGGQLGGAGRNVLLEEGPAAENKENRLNWPVQCSP